MSRTSLSLALVVTLAATALTAGAALPAAASGATPAGNPNHRVNRFAASGPWNTKLPRRIPLAANSAAVVASLARDRKANSDVWALNTATWSAPIYTVGPKTPRTAWRYDNCTGQTGGLYPGFADALASVPTLPAMLTSQGTDQEIAIYQPATDTYWDFWRATKDSSGQWSACWGGKIEHYSTNPGIFDHPLGATATGLPLGAFLIRINELKRGHIDHAVNLGAVTLRKGCASWPANRDDGNTDSVDVPCEGQRFRLDPTFDVSTLASPAGRTIARAMQEYGAIVTDYSGALMTQAEDPRPYMRTHHGVNPYRDLVDPQHTYPDELLDYVALYDLPVDRLQALPLDYGKPKAP